MPSTGRIEQLSDRGAQYRQLMLDDIPNQDGIDVPIPMDEPISERDDPPPWHRIAPTSRWREPAGRLPDDFCMHTSRAYLDRFLDPKNDKVQLDTMQRAAAAVGRKLRLELA